MLQGCLAVIGGGVVLLVIVAILIGGGDDDQQSVGPTAIPSRAPTTSAQQAAQTAESAANTESSRNAPTLSAQQQEGSQTDAASQQAYVPIQVEEGRTLRGVAYSVVQDPIDDALSTFVGVVDSEADEFAFEQATLIVGCFGRSVRGVGVRNAVHAVRERTGCRVSL